MNTPRYHVFVVFRDPGPPEARLFGSYWTKPEAEEAAEREQRFWRTQARLVVVGETYERRSV